MHAIPRPRPWLLAAIVLGVAHVAFAQGAPPPVPGTPPASGPGFTPAPAQPFTPPPEPPPAPASPYAPVGAAEPPDASPAAAPAPGQPPPAQWSAPPPAAWQPGAPPPPPPEDPARVEEAHADRVVFFPTAYTHPAGTVYLSSYDILVLQAGWAVSDTTQISVSTVPLVFTEDVLVPIDLTVKTALVRDGPVRAAIMGSASGLIGFEQGWGAVGRVGAVAQFCLDEQCESHASFGGNTVLVGPAVLMATHAGLVWRFASWGSLLLEGESLIPLAETAGSANAVAIAPGLRLPHRTWALDFAVARPLDRGRDIPAIPLIAFTYRFLP